MRQTIVRECTFYDS